MHTTCGLYANLQSAIYINCGTQIAKKNGRLRYFKRSPGIGTEPIFWFAEVSYASFKIWWERLVKHAFTILKKYVRLPSNVVLNTLCTLILNEASSQIQNCPVFRG